MSKMLANLLRVSRRLRWVAVTIPATPPPTTTIRCISLALPHRFCLAWAEPSSLTCNRFNVLLRITEIWGAGFGMSGEFSRAGAKHRRVVLRSKMYSSSAAFVWKTAREAIQTRRSPAASDFRISGDCLAATGRRYLGNTGKATALRPFESNGLGRFRSDRGLLRSSQGPGEIADEIHADVCERGFDRELGSFVQAYGSKGVDASLLLLPLVGFLPATDPPSVERFRPLSKGFL